MKENTKNEKNEKNKRKIGGEERWLKN